MAIIPPYVIQSDVALTSEAVRKVQDALLAWDQGKPLVLGPGMRLVSTEPQAVIVPPSQILETATDWRPTIGAFLGAFAAVFAALLLGGSI